MATPPRAQFVDVVGYRDTVTGEFIVVTTGRVTVYLAPPFAAEPRTTLAQLFTSETGVGIPGNPFNALTGWVDFWAGSAAYDIKIEDTSADPKFAERWIRWEAQPSDKGILQSMLGDLIISSAQLASGAVTQAKLATGSIPPTTKPNGFTLAGPILVPANNTTDPNVAPGFTIRSVSPTEEIFIAALDHRIHSGTNCRFNITRNGSNVTGLTNITCTTTPGVVTLGAPLAVNDGDYIQLVPTAVSGSPQHLAATLHTLHYPLGN